MPGEASPVSAHRRLTRTFLLQGLCSCAACGSTLYLSGGNRKNPYYICRGLACDEHAYAKARALDTFVLNSIEEAMTGLDADGYRVGPGMSDEAWRAATYVPRPGGDDGEVEEAERALEEARADLDGFLSDTALHRTLGAERYNAAVADYVAAVNKTEADLAAARERTSGSWELVGRLWNTEWGWAERREWVERLVRSVTVARGREPLSERVEVDLR